VLGGRCPVPGWPQRSRERVDGLAKAGAKMEGATNLCGGDTASTGARDRGMHAEPIPPDSLNRRKHNATADTQLALAA
jgi:hypothetical protein